MIKIELVGLNTDFSNGTGEGTERYGFELYQNLIRNLDLDIKVFSTPDRKSYIKMLMLNNFDSPSIIHIPNFRYLFPIKRSKSAKMVVTAHDFQPVLYPQFSFDEHSSIKNKLHYILIKKRSLIRMLKADYLLVNSTQTKDEAVSLGYNKDKVFITPLGINRRFSSEIKQKGKTDLDKDFTVGYLGALRKRKNVEFAIKSLNNINDETIKFNIWGKEDYQYNYLKSISKNKNITFKGFAPEESLVGIYDSFDAFVFPSYHEGFGFPILEAQARGLPVIIYKDSKIPREVRKYCFEAEDPNEMSDIILDLKKNGYDENKRKIAMDYARSFTWGNSIELTIKAYQKIIG